jgi:fructosamine-3-kinase
VAEPFVKRAGPDTPSDFFAAEAAGLRWLAAAGPAAARTVEVLEVSADRIVLERLQPTHRSLSSSKGGRSAAEAFGRALARTHAAGADAFGAAPPGVAGDGYIGRQPMTLRPTATWGAFYADQRMLPYARAAERIGHLSRAGLASVERVAERLHAGELDDDRPPARIHGDLWSGNVLWTAEGAVLIDPAAHGGHGLTDLAMLHLFGAPGLAAITAGYAGAAALEPGWEQLIGLHQLHPLLVHAVSHGPAYGAEAAQVAARYA